MSLLGNKERRYVEAIEDGKIVRVSEEYALKERLFILRKEEEKMESPSMKNVKKDQKNDVFIGMNSLRRPLRKNENDLTLSLVDNFHWIIAEKRRSRNMTRKQLAFALGVSENDLKMVENGLLPSRDYVLISKIEDFFKINLRKDSINAPSFNTERNSEKVENPKENEHKEIEIADEDL